jgi:molybdopterin molybdotransferase
MIAVDEAKRSIRAHCQQMPVQKLPLAEAAQHVLAADVFAPYDIPYYIQSSMDGYAFAWADVDQPLNIVTAVAAGDGRSYTLKPGEAARVFTGAPVPAGADTVIMQERVEIRGQQLIIPADVSVKGDHVRSIGSDVRKDALAMAAGQLLTPTALAFLAAMGIDKVDVVPFPKIILLVTGNELIQPGEQPGHGKVFEASSFGLHAALNGLGFHQVESRHVRDDLPLITSVLQDALQKADLVLITGGVSVGDHDHTAAAAEASGVHCVFHKVKQRPGKPLFFGMKENIPVFGLPGNPSSVLSCFYQYVLEALAAMTGRNIALKTSKARLLQEYRKPATLTHFLKAVYADGDVRISTAQESYKLSAFSSANCFVQIPEETSFVPANSIVDIHHLPVS